MVLTLCSHHECPILQSERRKLSVVEEDIEDEDIFAPYEDDDNCALLDAWAASPRTRSVSSSVSSPVFHETPSPHLHELEEITRAVLRLNHCAQVPSVYSGSSVYGDHCDFSQHCVDSIVSNVRHTDSPQQTEYHPCHNQTAGEPASHHHAADFLPCEDFNSCDGTSTASSFHDLLKGCGLGSSDSTILSSIAIDYYSPSAIKHNDSNSKLDEGSTDSSAIELLPVEPQIASNAAPTTTTTLSITELLPNLKRDMTLRFPRVWIAWYDPPKGKGRQAIDCVSYEKSLVRLGRIANLEDYWGTHDSIDWEQLPLGSMISFGEEGAKPYWEDPAHCAGGRLVIRGCPRMTSPHFFSQLATSLFREQLDRTKEFVTCISLQMKERRQGHSAIQIWTRTRRNVPLQNLRHTINRLYHRMPPCSPGRRRSDRTAEQWPIKPPPLTIDFCVNSAAIQRNNVRLGQKEQPAVALRAVDPPSHITDLNYSVCWYNS